MGKNQNTWLHKTKIIFREIKITFHPLGCLAGFPARVIVLWQVKSQRHSERITCRRPLQWFLNVWDNVLMDLKYVCQQYFTVCGQKYWEIKKKFLYNKQKPYFFKKILWSHFWIDLNKFYTKIFGIVYILIVYLLIMLLWVISICT
jgi:hypothetical protein